MLPGQAWVLDKEAFAQKNSFSGWGFDYTWRMDEMLGRPILRSIPESAVTISGKTGYRRLWHGSNTGFICLFGFYRYRRAAKCVCLYHHKRQRHLRCDAQRRYPDGSGNCGGGDYPLLMQVTAKSQTRNPLVAHVDSDRDSQQSRPVLYCADSQNRAYL